MKKHKIKEITRIGIVKRYIFQIQTLAHTFIDKTIGKTLSGVNDINLNFSKRLPIDEAIAQKDILDYYNAIFNVAKKADLDEIFMAIDFQKYFDPFLKDVTDIKFNKFTLAVDRFNNDQYLPWLNSNYGD